MLFYNFLTYIIGANGVYDILCSISILHDWCPFSRLHPNMFISDEHVKNPVIRRIMAFWILTYGTIRLITSLYSPFMQPGIYDSIKNYIPVDSICAFTYLIEALYFVYEQFVGDTMHPYKVQFVCLTSMNLGILVLLRGANHMNIIHPHTNTY